MKNTNGIFLIVFLAVLLIAFNGCGDGDSEIQSKIITENDLFANPQLIATPEHTLVIQLEAPDGEGHDNDIGEKGIDEVPVYYSEDVNQTFCWEGDASDVGDRMVLIDSSGNTVLTEYIDDECTGATLTAGHYTMRFTHGGQSEVTQTIFIRLGEDNVSSRGIINVSIIQDNIDTLISTNSCRGCILRGANLRGANLTGADLTGADLYHAYLTGANLRDAYLIGANLTEAELEVAHLSGAKMDDAYLIGANLTGASLICGYLMGANLRGANLEDTYMISAELRGANLNAANLYNADLTGAKLFWAYLIGANLSCANLEGAYLIGADLTGADLEDANLSGADLTEANLSGATWIDGSLCWEWSVGECIH